MSKHIRKRVTALSRAIVVGLAMVSGCAWATDFEFGDGWRGSWTSSISLGTAIRAGKQDSRLYGQGNGALVGKPNGSGANATDEGDLNYNAGDAFTRQLKLISEVSLQKGDMGALIRVKGWYDDALENDNVHLGSQANGWNGYNLATNTLGKPQPLSDKGFEDLTKFKGVYLLDAYIYDTFDVVGHPLQVRAGNQVVNWGESLFIQGVNQIAPIDLPSFRKPGAELKEVFLPVPMLYFNQSLGDAGSLEAFYQVKWKDTPIEAGCGNYWAIFGGNLSSRPGDCSYGITIAPAPYPANGAFGYDAGAYVPFIDGKKGGDSGEFGLAYRFTPQALDTEFGIYAEKLNSRTPTLDLQYGPNGTASPFAGRWDYVDGIKIFGISAATNLFGWSIGAEFSQQIGVPAQIDGADLLYSGLFAAQGLSVGPDGARALAAYNGDGSYLGYDRTNKQQLQINGVKAGNHMLGSDQYVFVAEVGFQTNSLNIDPNGVRYGRNFIFGPGSSPSYGVLGLPGGDTCLGGFNINAEGCQNDGYVTHFAWGYRLKLDLTYNNIFNSGVTAIPSVFFSQDVKGVSVDSQFSQDRMALGLSSKFVYSKKYTLEVGSILFNRTAEYDPTRDRGYYYVNLSAAF